MKEQQADGLHKEADYDDVVLGFGVLTTAILGPDHLGYRRHLWLGAPRPTRPVE